MAIELRVVNSKHFVGGGTQGKRMIDLYPYVLAISLGKPSKAANRYSCERVALKRRCLMLRFLSGSWRSRFRVMWRRMAPASGPLPMRVRMPSSLNATSRTQCNWFSMPQCERTLLAMVSTWRIGIVLM